MEITEYLIRRKFLCLCWPACIRVCIFSQETARSRVNDLRRVVAYGVMALPALVIDEKVVAGGSVLPVEEIMEIIRHLN